MTDAGGGGKARKGTPPEFDKYCTVTIQGGGIFGISLLGQLRALEQVGVSPIAYAGTSAGAIIAALAWAGYSADDIVEEIVALSRKRALVGLIGPFRHGKDGSLFRPRSLGAMISSTASLVGLAFRRRRQPSTDPALVTQAPAADSRWRRLRGGVIRAQNAAARGLEVRARLARVVLGGYLFRRTLLSLYDAVFVFDRQLGFFSGNRFEEWLDELFVRKLRSEGFERDIRKPTFGDFFQHRYVHERSPKKPALFLTATNIGRRDVELLDSLSRAFHDIPVSRAVRASSGFPLFFRPVSFRVWRDPLTGRHARSEAIEAGKAAHERGLYVDGGVVANFPLWLVERELRDRLWESGEIRAPDSVGPSHPMRGLAFRPLVHFGLRLVRHPADEPTEAAGPGEKTAALPNPHPVESYASVRRTRSYLTALIDMLIGGVRTRLESQLVSSIGRAVLTNQRYALSGAPGGVLAFDRLNPRTIRDMFDLGFQAAHAEVSQYQATLPRASAEVVDHKGRPLGNIRDILQRLANDASQILRLAGGEPKTSVRTSVFVVSGQDLKLQYPFNILDERERHLVFSARQGLVGVCFTERHQMLCNPQRAAAAGEYFQMTPEQRSHVRQDTNWIMVFPIMDPAEARPWKPRYAGIGATPIGDFLHVIGPSLPGAPLGVLGIDAVLSNEAFPACPGDQIQKDELQWLVDIAGRSAARVGDILGSCFWRRAPSQERDAS